MKALRFSNVFLVSMVTASTLKVPSQYFTIQAAVDAATEADTVLVAPGIYKENIEINNPFRLLASHFVLYPDSLSLIDETVIDGDSLGSCIQILSLESGELSLEGFTITNGNGRSSGNEDSGGGIYCRSPLKVELHNLIIDSNSAVYGGGVSIDGGKVVFSAVTIRNNHADHGGGVNIYGGDIIFDEVKILNNTATHGGGIRSTNHGTVQLVTAIVSGNKASWHGAGIWGGGTHFSINNSKIFDNEAPGNSDGGGLYCRSCPEVKITRSLLFANRSAGGAGIYLDKTVLIAENNTITDNVASHSGGAIKVIRGSEVSILNSILWSNTPDQISTWNYEESNIVKVAYSDLEGDSVKVDLSNGDSLMWLNGNINSNPMFQNAVAADYTLKENSPCVDSGDPNYMLDSDCSITDQGAFESDFGSPVSPNAFELISPPDADSVIINLTNNWSDTLFFAWNKPDNLTQECLEYDFQFSGDLRLLKWHLSDHCKSESNMCKVPYHRLEDFLSIEGVEIVTGEWDIIAENRESRNQSSNGAFSLTIDASSVKIDDHGLIPKSFALHASYPNPFNPTTAISYDLPMRSQVILSVYDILGKQVKTLVNQQHEAGVKTAVWDGTDDLGRPVGGGVYLFQIQAGDFTEARKMLLLK